MTFAKSGARVPVEAHILMSKYVIIDRPTDYSIKSFLSPHHNKYAFNDVEGQV